ncbi:hypothetical protein JVU11DRAFT_2246 [Chiua virens]|nr:hypothetical protein JVU11DRAFT_2246 [Chiua virens]
MATITVRTKYIAPAEPTFPALAVQITRLVGSYMVWVGVTEETAETVENAPLSGSLCKDWACAMPGMGGNGDDAVSDIRFIRRCVFDVTATGWVSAMSTSKQLSDIYSETAEQASVSVCGCCEHTGDFGCGAVYN